MTEEVSYSNLCSDAHGIVTKILREDSTLKKFTTNIIDGNPVFKSKLTGFPYILVRTPKRTEEKLTYSNNINDERRLIILEFPIIIVSRQERIVREISDKVLSALKNNQNTTKKYLMYLFGDRIRTVQTEGFLPNSKTYIYTNNLTVPYRVYLK